ncbi:MAG: hypothetical protein COV29_00320 [Candidatus Yanofskybacteria bacterium CG10_big_fil_rev_8_21_14_0_10_36_16]|uniref:Uncharacterized protein n=1 Tax=Candidatus Yanofskybacteria bacterium CG10_big_fil_rev_8_21_14_0_10_36_16 TaxID=1975096 RepID=A0A2J0Q8K8_9BACT|nr:MAG: hypothetical protein COV29_00320 [Candidatus Yanofskybacteria bacterium CG10_big_fil_rev_8_21_14_0_10_36_16]
MQKMQRDDVSWPRKVRGNEKRRGRRTPEEEEQSFPEVPLGLLAISSEEARALGSVAIESLWAHPIRFEPIHAGRLH